MYTDLALIEYPFILRAGLFVALVLLTVRYTARGLQNGLLLGIVTGMTYAELFEGPGLLPMITLDRVIWPIVFIFFFLKWRRGETNKLPLDWVEYSMIALIAVILISILTHDSYAGEVHGEEALRLGAFLRGFAMPFAAYFLARRGVCTIVQVKSFLVGVGAVALYLIFTGVAEAWGIDLLVFPRSILNPNFGIHAEKVRGVFFNASHNGLAIAMALPILIWLCFNDRGVRRWVWVLIAVFAGVPLAYSMQRAAWFSAAMALVVTALAWPRQRIVLTGILILAAAGSFFVVSDTLVEGMEEKWGDRGTVDARLDLARTSWEVIREYPITGVGFNKFSEMADAYSPYRIATTTSHNTVLSIFSELGLVGMIPYMAIFGFLLFSSLDIYFRRPQYRTIIGILWGVTGAYVVVMMAVEMRIRLYPNALLFALWGMILEMVRRQETAVQDVENKSQRIVVNFI